jgi:hypothetical protein
LAQGGKRTPFVYTAPGSFVTDIERKAGMDSTEFRSGQSDAMGCLLQIFLFLVIVVALVILFVGIGIGLLLTIGV